jgi:hypothetical protein
MNDQRKGIIVGVLQCALALSVTGKLLYDRATRPKVWVHAVRRDPEMPIRGRYLALQLVPEITTPYFARLDRQQVVFFVPEHPAEFERSGVGRSEGSEIWAEVTIPRKGSPRPIRLGLKQAGRIQPMDVR